MGLSHMGASLCLSLSLPLPSKPMGKCPQRGLTTTNPPTCPAPGGLHPGGTRHIRPSICKITSLKYTEPSVPSDDSAPRGVSMATEAGQVRRPGGPLDSLGDEMVGLWTTGFRKPVPKGSVQLMPTRWRPGPPTRRRKSVGGSKKGKSMLWERGNI